MSFADLVEIDTSKMEKEEKEEEILIAKKLARDTAELQLIMSDLNKIIIDSGTQLEDTNKIITETQEILNETSCELETAQKYQSPLSIFKMTGLCTILGIVIGGPLGAFGGSYLGLALGGGIFGTLTGGSVAGGTAYSVYKKKQKNNKEKID